MGDVAVALIPDVDAVEAVVENRNPDEEQLQQKNARGRLFRNSTCLP
jgi:hypothetical protein